MLLAITRHLRLLSVGTSNRSLGPFPHRPVRPTLSTIYIKPEPSTVKVCGVRSALEYRQVSVRRRLGSVPAPRAGPRRRGRPAPCHAHLGRTQHAVAPPVA